MRFGSPVSVGSMNSLKINSLFDSRHGSLCALERSKLTHVWSSVDTVPSVFKPLGVSLHFQVSRITYSAAPLLTIVELQSSIIPTN